MTNDKPLFSVLMANYNNAHYIVEAINSIRQQTYSNWEIIIVDDASTDDSLEILQAFADEPRINVFSNATNLGCGATKRRAAELANGAIAGYLDPDDALYPEALEVMVNAHLEHPRKSLIYSIAYFCDEQMNPTFLLNWVGPIPRGKSNLHVSKAGPFATFKMEHYRRTDGINPRLLRGVDQDLYYRLEEVGETLYIDRPLYLYRVHVGGISTLQNKIKAKRWVFYAKKEAYLRRQKQPSLAPNLSFWRLFWDYRHMQYKTIREAVLRGEWSKIWAPLRKFFFTPNQYLINYPPPE
jgi:glycosyltransferase involved in cell wall biosynthesis